MSWGIDRSEEERAGAACHRKSAIVVTAGGYSGARPGRDDTIARATPQSTRPPPPPLELLLRIALPSLTPNFATADRFAWKNEKKKHHDTSAPSLRVASHLAVRGRGAELRDGLEGPLGGVHR
jgi:hypothetical protein